MTTATARGRTRLVLDDDPAEPVKPDDQPECEHGPLVRRAGYGRKSGRPYAGFYCSQTPGCQAPVWVTDEVIAAALEAWQADDPAGEFAKPAEPKPAKDTAADAASAAVDDVPPF